ncbi:ABC transporter ATP-binding protein [Echinicola soli]|uniref:ABC transporter ATP-binding protein n=1 Tax=Echinicola soli TaxID=2591634 RepID=A0A514CNB5_9BACT|nr:ABC transporter ATP-binding protein [Echinicola soli]QDH81316.1 ABC transporter ATP-binding protein [Echinicola soli]
MDNPIIKLNRLTKYYGSFKAVGGLDLEINKGEIFGLLGPNGAGKTTTILMMMGLTEPSSGSAEVCGFDATTNPIAVKRQVGYMPDSVGFYDNMTALENLMYMGSLNGIPHGEVRNRALATMETVGLTGDTVHKKTAAYSRGMKQRLGLAEVLIKEPQVVVLDEPTLGIDPSGVKEFLSLISSLSKERGLTVLLSSHHLHQVQQVCDRVGIFVKGELLGQGSIHALSRKLFAQNAPTVKIKLADRLEIPWKDQDEMLGLAHVEEVSVRGDLLEIASSADVTPEIVRFLVHKGYGITGVQNREYGLEDIYQTYFDNQKIEYNLP